MFPLPNQTVFTKLCARFTRSFILNITCSEIMDNIWASYEAFTWYLTSEHWTCWKIFYNLSKPSYVALWVFSFLDWFACLSGSKIEIVSFLQIFSGGPVLAALVSGQAAKSFEDMTIEEATQKVMITLRGIFTPKEVNVPDPLQVMLKPHLLCTKLFWELWHSWFESVAFIGLSIWLNSLWS